jgi:hypothetical protein
MSERAAQAKLIELQNKGINVYSISRLDSINNCLYEAFQTYVKGDRGESNIYAFAGSKIHDVLEKIMNNEAEPADLYPAMMDELDDMEMLGVEFPKDSNGNETLKNNWIKNMTHFCETYEKPVGDFSTEEFFLYKTKNGHYLQGYIDLQENFDDGSISIYDYKTSSMYSGEEIKKHGRQLLVYAMAKIQEGYRVNSIAWNMLKYARIEFMGYKTAKSKEKSLISKIVERRKIAAELNKYICADLSENGFEEVEFEFELEKFRQSNLIEDLPEVIRDNYKVYPAIIQYELSLENIQECENYINNTIERWEKMSGNEEDYGPCKFTKLQKNGREVLSCFYCTSLCNHKNCHFLQEFLEKWNQEQDEEHDMFA